MQNANETCCCLALHRCPLQNQLHDVARFKPMTATATTMVKSIWQSYFRPAGAKPEEEGEQPTAKVGAWTARTLWAGSKLFAPAEAAGCAGCPPRAGGQPFSSRFLLPGPAGGPPRRLLPPAPSPCRQLIPIHPLPALFCPGPHRKWRRTRMRRRPRTTCRRRRWRRWVHFNSAF